MTKNCIIKQIEAGRIPEDQLCVLTPVLANQRDPVAADLLIYIGKLELWRRWGFESLEDYIEQAEVPESIMRCVAAYLLAEDLHQPFMRMDRGGEARQAVVRLCEDRPIDVSHEEFSKRYHNARELLDRCRAAFTD